MATTWWLRRARRTRRFLGRYKLELACWARSAWGPNNRHQRQRKVLIFALGRTGSTLLEDLLVSTGMFHGQGEALHPSLGERLWPARYLDGLALRQRRHHFCAHVKIFHLLRRSRPAAYSRRFLRQLHRQGWQIIALSRRNPVQHALSSVIAEHRQAYHKTDDAMELFRLTIDGDRFQANCRRLLAAQQRQQAALAGLPHLALCYEDHLAEAGDHQTTVARICDWLDLPRRPARTALRKINRWQPEEIIVNFDQFRSLVWANGWQEFLPEETKRPKK